MKRLVLVLTGCLSLATVAFSGAPATDATPRFAPGTTIHRLEGYPYIGPAEDILESMIGAEGIGDPYFPTLGNGGYNALHYTLDVDLDMTANVIEAITTIEAETLHDLSQFNLDFTPELEVVAVWVNGDSATFEQVEQELVIQPALTLPEGEPFTIEIEYEGEPDWTYYENGVMAAGEPTGSSGWFPINEHPLDKATYSFFIMVDADYVVAANGVLEHTQVKDDGRITYEWQARDPIANYLVTLAVGDFNVVTATTEAGVPVRNYFADRLSRQVIANFDRMPEMIDFYETVFGPYPFEVYGVVVHNLDLGFALETQTLSTFGRAFTHEMVVAHELVHQWFGNSVSLSKWQDIWLNEGFATYGEVLWIEHAYGEDVAEERVRDMYAAMANINPTITVTPDQLRDLLADLPFGLSVLTRDQVEAALKILLGDNISQTDLMILLLTEDTRIPAANLPNLVASAPFTQATIGLRQYGEFLRAIRLEDVADRITGATLVGDPSPQRLFSGVVYQRGGLTLHALRLEIGDEAFFDTLRTYTERFYHRNATTDDFIAIAEEVSGQQLDDFFEGWLFQAAIPDIPAMGLTQADFVR